MNSTRQRPRAAPMGAGDHAGVRIPPPLVYVVGFSVGVALEAAAPSPDMPSLVAGLVGTAMVGVGVLLSITSMRAFRRAGTSVVPIRPTTALLTGGVYARTRNPMYLALAFLYAGLAVGFSVLWALAMLPVVLLVIDRDVIIREERYLERAFGDEYRRYRRVVRRWI